MRIFKDNYKPIEIEIVDNAGNKRQLRSQFMTQKDWLRISDTSKLDKKYTYNCHFMANVFGGKAADYEGFSAELLTDVISYYNDQVKNPTQAQD